MKSFWFWVSNLSRPFVPGPRPKDTRYNGTLDLNGSKPARERHTSTVTISAEERTRLSFVQVRRVKRDEEKENEISLEGLGLSKFFISEI